MNNYSKASHWDNMYRKPLGQIPWEIKNPPKELVELIESGLITGGAVLDIACGTGNYSLYLAKHGFVVSGIDFSKKAIAIAEKKAEAIKLPVSFMVGDITKIESFFVDTKFDLILDYSILHHIEPTVLHSYAKQCINLLKPGGKILLVCYSDKDGFPNGNKSAQGTYGNVMYYYSESEIKQAYSGLKILAYSETRLGKRLHHFAHHFLFEKS